MATKKSSRKKPRKATASRKKTPAAAAVAVMPAAHQWTDGGDKVLTLRRCNADGTSYGGFKWPLEVGAKVEPGNWTPTATCGDGLHGWPWGMGLGEGANFCVATDTFVVFSAAPEDVIGEIEGGYKCKSRCAEVVAFGSFGKCWDVIDGGRRRLIDAMAASGAPSASSGYYSKAASSGDSSTAASSGYSSKAASSGDSSTAASSGYSSTAASSGYYSKAASSGNYTLAAVAGIGGKAKAGPHGAICLAFKNADGDMDFAVGRVGHNIEPDTWYEVIDGKLAKANG